jgi:hypothetical protein
MNPSGLPNEDSIEKELLSIARDQMSSLVVHTLREEIGRQIIEEINLNPNSGAADIGEEMHRVVAKSVERVQKKVADSLDADSIGRRAKEREAVLEQAMTAGDWKRHFRGRDVLRTFAGRHCAGMRYEHFRNLIVSTMASASFKPEGMRRVFHAISQD